MPHKFKLLLTLNILALLGLGVFSPPAQAALDLSIVPIDGGTTIRFSRGDLTQDVVRQVRVRITSDQNVQYQVFQQIANPFTNERGVQLLRPALEASILPGSNTAGTTYLSTYEQVTNMGNQLLFTSSPGGQSDSFTIVYRVNTANLTDSGSFNGRMMYTVRQISGGTQQDVQTDFFIESNAELKVDVEGSNGLKMVRLSSSPVFPPEHLTVNFSGNLGGRVKVYEEVLRYPTDDLNSELNSDILKLVTSGSSQGGDEFQSPADIPRNRTLIYNSTQLSDSFSVNYVLTSEKLMSQRAGTYRGLVRYSFDTDSVQKDFDIDLEITIAPIFEIVMDFPQGPVNYSKVLPGQEPVIKEVDVKVNTNLDKPYSVVQHLPDLLTNEKGESIPEKYFMFREDLSDGSKARVTAPDYMPLVKGDSDIFYSDPKGSPEQFKVFYRLSSYAGMRPGDYRSTMKYSLDEL